MAWIQQWQTLKYVLFSSFFFLKKYCIFVKLMFSLFSATITTPTNGVEMRQKWCMPRLPANNKGIHLRSFGAANQALPCWVFTGRFDGYTNLQSWSTSFESKKIGDFAFQPPFFLQKVILQIPLYFDEGNVEPCVFFFPLLHLCHRHYHHLLHNSKN